MKTQLGHYAIVSELGRGGMGVVYKGYETSLNRYVAIKVLADSLAHDASVKERFLREARSMASLNDPHIIQIYFIGDDEGQTFFVMEFVDGESLGSVLKREGKLKAEQAAKIIYQTAMGLSTAHDRGVIHRDIKPGNLMLTARGSVKIADFGIALTTQDFSKKLTSTGEFVGTPGYLSPEVCLGKPVDQRSDIFSLGIVMFECLAGRMPFTDESPLGLMLEVVKAEIPDVCTLNSEVDPELSGVLTRMIAKDPAERYQSCHELVADLGQHPLVARGGPITLQTKMTTAAATMIGQKTPVSGQQALPGTTPTPRPMPAMGSLTPQPASATTAARAAPDPGAPVHQSVLERGATPNRSALPLAIAAIVFLLLVSAAWAFSSDRIPAQLAQWFPTQVAAPPAAPGRLLATTGRGGDARSAFTAARSNCARAATAAGDDRCRCGGESAERFVERYSRHRYDRRRRGGSRQRPSRCCECQQCCRGRGRERQRTSAARLAGRTIARSGCRPGRAGSATEAARRRCHAASAGQRAAAAACPDDRRDRRRRRGRHRAGPALNRTCAVAQRLSPGR